MATRSSSQSTGWGKQAALAPLLLRILDERLDECSRCAVKYINRYDVVFYVDMSFLQMFFWERFGALSPVPIEFKHVKPQKVIINRT